MDREDQRFRILNIKWDGIFCHFIIEIENGQISDFYLVSKAGNALAKLKKKELPNNGYDLSVNITNVGNNHCLPVGVCYLIAVYDGQTFQKGICREINTEWEKHFSYRNNSESYEVKFGISEKEILEICVAETKRNTIKKSIKKLYQFIFRQLYRIDLIKNKHKTKKKKTILFLTEQSMKLNRNLEIVQERLYERELQNKYEILTSARSSVAVKNYNLKSWSTLFNKLSKADMIILDDHVPFMDWLKISEHTQVIQLWHAGIGFKSTGYSRWGHKGSPAPFNCHRQYQYGISGSLQTAHIFAEAFGIDESQILPTGLPRMDDFLDSAYQKVKQEELKELYPICKGKKVILFAPTYRGVNASDAHYPYEKINFDTLYDTCGQEWIVLFKMHPWVRSAVPIPEKYKDKFLDVTKYSNINDFFYLTDLLISDYSSNIYEYSLLEKPCLFYAFDKTDYRRERGFHDDYEEQAPGKVCYTFEEIIQAIETEDFEREKITAYCNRNFDHTEKGACDRVIDWIISGQLPQKYQARLDQHKKEIQELKEMKFSM